MGSWLLNLPVVWMSIVILGGLYLFAAAVYVLITALAVGERARTFKAISPGMLPPLAIIFAVLVGFLAAQVWSESDRANVAVNREASALRGVVLLAAGFPGEPERHLRDLVRRQIQDAATQEWAAMARGSDGGAPRRSSPSDIPLRSLVTEVPCMAWERCRKMAGRGVQTWS